MPCTSDGYPETPTKRNAQLQTVAAHLVYFNKCAGVRTHSSIVADSKDSFCRRDRAELLCSALNDLLINDEPKFSAIVYNGREPKARRLADWWEEHQRIDDARKKREAVQAAEARAKAESTVRGLVGTKQVFTYEDVVRLVQKIQEAQVSVQARRRVDLPEGD